MQLTANLLFLHSPSVS